MKRSFDVSVAVIGSIVLAPIFAAIALGVFCTVGRPVLFVQERAGLAGRPFLLLKFRTMSNTRAPDGTLLPDEARTGRFGRFLRATSLDELPGLWNVARGDMSLVGPRPLLMDYLPLYTASQARRHDVRPGITGWAQVNGRNSLSWEERFRLDVWYVDNRSFWLDVRILLVTARRVLARDGISPAGELTMPRFMGSTEGKSG